MVATLTHGKVGLEQTELLFKPRNGSGQFGKFGMYAVDVLLLPFELYVNYLQVGQLRVDVLLSRLEHLLLLGNVMLQGGLLALQ